MSYIYKAMANCWNMKLLFIIIYTVISTHPTPCPDSDAVFSCAVYHGMTTDTTVVEIITTDASKISDALRVDQKAKIDTFLLTRIGG